jgi:uncharacterized DUF497 family protein
VHPDEFRIYRTARFEWDVGKCAANEQKHFVSFQQASTVFFDTGALDAADLSHSNDECRRLRLGTSADGQVMVVAYTMRRRTDEEAIRIISARLASRKERKRYGASKD